MGRGIIGTIQLGATLAVALPVGFLGADMLVSGETAVGVAFLGLAALMVAMEEYLTTPTDVPAAAAERVAGAVAKDPEETDDAE